jgi:hypothetical protein
MTTYLPLYTKGAAGIPALATDPACTLYLPFWKKDGLYCTSDDKYGHVITRSGAISTPKGWYFDGTDDWAEGPNKALFCPDEASVIVWANQTVANSNAILICRYNCDWLTYYTGWRLYAHNNGCFDFTYSDGTYPPVFASSSICVTQGIWNMYAVTHNRVFGTKYYLNGKYINTVNDTRAMSNYNGPLNLGRYNWFKGTKGEALMFSRVLSATEMMDYYTLSKGRYL